MRSRDRSSPATAGRARRTGSVRRTAGRDRRIGPAARTDRVRRRTGWVRCTDSGRHTGWASRTAGSEHRTGRRRTDSDSARHTDSETSRRRRLLIVGVLLGGRRIGGITGFVDPVSVARQAGNLAVSGWCLPVVRIRIVRSPRISHDNQRKASKPQEKKQTKGRRVKDCPRSVYSHCHARAFNSC